MNISFSFSDEGMMKRTHFQILLTLLGWLVATGACADQAPTAFSQQVQAITGDWVAEDWRQGGIKLHPASHDWQSKNYIEFFPARPGASRSPQDFLAAAFPGAEVNDQTVQFTKITDLIPGVYAASFPWQDIFGDNITLFGAVAPAEQNLIPFTANCQVSKDERQALEACLAALLKVTAALQNKSLLMPEIETPLSVPGWENVYLNDGTALVSQQDRAGLRHAKILVSLPQTVTVDQVKAQLLAYADQWGEEEDGHASPPSWAGLEQMPVAMRSYPDVFEGPALQFASAVPLTNGRYSFVVMRCPNKNWLTTCQHGFTQTIEQIQQGLVEQRRERLVNASQLVPPGNGLTDEEIVGLYSTGDFRIGVGGFLNHLVITGHLYLKDGTVYRNFDRAPELIIKGEPASDWGKWQKLADKIEISWPDGSQESIALKDSQLMVGAPAGVKLEGQFRAVSGSGDVALGGGNATFHEESYFFWPDGRFTTAQSSSFMVGLGEVASGASQKAMGQAHYEISGYHLILSFPDGRKSYLGVALPQADLQEGKISGIMLNGTFYARVEKNDGK